ncbi:hypothetical protein CK203_117755 [Vitis vinifera]|uniref:Uncharacterized protein n=1 Tax=Vitis vinifera TaxID=29760 RepID=A0A438CXU1_VITVI|nr:hypothetical protein CK203_117755 [Vitis vinifera]
MGDGRFLWQPMQALVNFVQTPPHASATYTYPISFNSPSSHSAFSSSAPQSHLYQALMSHHQGPVTAYPPPSHVYPPPTPYPPPGQVYPPPPSWEGQHQVIYVAAPPPVGYPWEMVKGTHKITVRLRPKAGVTASGKDVLLPCAAAVSWTAAFN